MQTTYMMQERWNRKQELLHGEQDIFHMFKDNGQKSYGVLKSFHNIEIKYQISEWHRYISPWRRTSQFRHIKDSGYTILLQREILLQAQ